ncbi:unnamed protein product [Closterium sp. NIES-65]|nr:unnamed protein product [Closterium sp. NIES-65]
MAIIQQLWAKAGTGYTGKTDGSPLTFGGLLTVASNAAMCNAVVAKVGAIGYAHVSACAAQVKKFNTKIAEVALKNALGPALTSKTWVATNALNGATRPAPDASWDQVNLIWKSIAKAPAAVSMQYVFVKKVLPKNGGAVAKQFLVSSLAKFKGSAVANGFNFVPPSWFNPSANAVKAVTLPRHIQFSFLYALAFLPLHQSWFPYPPQNLFHSPTHALVNPSPSSLSRHPLPPIRRFGGRLKREGRLHA